MLPSKAPWPPQANVRGSGRNWADVGEPEEKGRQQEKDQEDKEQQGEGANSRRK